MPNEYEKLLFDALIADYGICVTSSSPEQLRQKLYAIRRRDDSFTNLAFVILKESELWIIKKEHPDASGEEQQPRQEDP